MTRKSGEPHKGWKAAAKKYLTTQSEGHTMTDIPENCEKCGCELNGEAAYIEATDEVWCHSCADNAAEAAYERHQESFHDGGATSWMSLQDQQIAAMKLK